MANNESSFQKEIIDAAKARGCHAFKNASGLGITKVDLYVKMPGIDRPFWLELKWVKPGEENQKLSITKRQQGFLQDAIDSDAHAAVVVGRQIGPLLWELTVMHHTKEYYRDGIVKITRQRGADWDIQSILIAAVVAGQNRQHFDPEGGGLRGFECEPPIDPTLSRPARRALQRKAAKRLPRKGTQSRAAYDLAQGGKDSDGSSS